MKTFEEVTKVLFDIQETFPESEGAYWRSTLLTLAERERWLFALFVDPKYSGLRWHPRYNEEYQKALCESSVETLRTIVKFVEVLSGEECPPYVEESQESKNL